MYDDYEFDGKDSGASTIVGVLILCGVILGGAFGLIYYLQGDFAGRQFLGALLVPVGFFWLMLFVGAMTATFTKQRFLAVVLWLSMVALSLLGNKTVANNLMSGLESAYRPVSVDEMEILDYGFVLGGGASVASNRQIDLNESGERIIEAIRLHKAGKIRHLVFTGSPHLYAEDETKAKVAPVQAPQTDSTEPQVDSNLNEVETEDSTEQSNELTSGPYVSQDTDLSSSGLSSSGENASADPQTPPVVEERMLHAYEDAMRNLLTAHGVPADAYTFLGGRYTQEEMQRIDDFLQDNPATNSGLITSAFHMNRAVRLAHKQGLTLISLPVDFRAGNVVDDPVFFIPKIGELSTSSTAIKEYVSAWLQ